MKLPVILAHANLDVFIAVMFIGGVALAGVVGYAVWLGSKSSEVKEQRDQNRGGL
jgi:hypothetical protein